MKKIVFRQVYMCTNCYRKIVGHINTCPICKLSGEKHNIVKTKEDKIITLVKQLKK